MNPLLLHVLKSDVLEADPNREPDVDCKKGSGDLPTADIIQTTEGIGCPLSEAMFTQLQRIPLWWDQLPLLAVDCYKVDSHLTRPGIVIAWAPEEGTVTFAWKHLWTATFYQVARIHDQCDWCPQHMWFLRLTSPPTPEQLLPLGQLPRQVLHKESCKIIKLNTWEQGECAISAKGTRANVWSMDVAQLLQHSHMNRDLTVPNYLPGTLPLIIATFRLTFICAPSFCSSSAAQQNTRWTKDNTQI